MWKWLLEQVMNYIIGNDIFGQIKTIVINVSKDDTLTGTEKKEKVLAEVKQLSSEIKTHLINLAIEAAVALIREKTKTK